MLVSSFISIFLLKDQEVFSSDFEDSIIGQDYVSENFKRGFTLFIPEVLVDKIPMNTESGQHSLEESLASHEAKERQMSREDFVNEQKDEMALATATKKSLEEYKETKDIVEALRVAGEDTDNLSQQQEEYRKIQEESAQGMARKGVHDQPSGMHSHGHEQGDVSRKNQEEYAVIDTLVREHSDQEHRSRIQQQGGHFVNRQYNRSNSFSDDHRRALYVKDKEEGRHASSGAILDHHDHLPQGLSVAATTGDGPPLNIGVGYLIQIPCPGPEHPVRYGTVKWIGFLPNVVGHLAGIELVKFVPLCVCM